MFGDIHKLFEFWKYEKKYDVKMPYIETVLQ